MPTPVNYVDLFDRLYPEQLLSGLASDGDITVEELNARYDVIRANQRTMVRALTAVYAAQADTASFREFVLPFWEVAYTRKYTIGAPEVAALRYLSGRDSAGVPLSFPETRLALHATDCGGSLFSADRTEVLVFSNGLLVSSEDYTTHYAQGGFSVYLKETKVQVGGTVRVVALRKFNQRGVTFPSIPAPVQIIPDPDVGGLSAGHLVFDLQQLGHVHDIRYYALFAKKTGDLYFRPVSPASVSMRTEPGNDTVVVGLTGPYAVPGAYSFVLIDKAEFWKREWSYTINGWLTGDIPFPLGGEAGISAEEPLWHLSLITNGLPAPVISPKDVDIWVNGRKLYEGVDYWVEFGTPDVPDVPPRIVFNDIHYGDTLHIYAVSNAPKDDGLSVEVYRNLLPASSIVSLDPNDRTMHLVPDVGLAFAGGALQLAADGIETIADNLALHFLGLSNSAEFEYRMRTVLPPELYGALLQMAAVPTPLERFARTINSVAPDGTIGQQGWDLVGIHALNHPTPVVPAVPPTRTDYPVIYFFLRYGDTSTLAALTAGRNKDPGVLDVYRQGDVINVDCRQQSRGPTDNTSFDFRS